jgi:prepilin peptidase CpaA
MVVVVSEVGLVPVAANAVAMTLRVCFVLLLAAAAAIDVRARRVPNLLSGALAALGLVAAACGAASGNMLTAVLALGAGLALWLPFYAFGILGAGDVKLFAAGAAWLTPMATVSAALDAALVGGALGVAWMFYARGTAFTVTRVAHAIRQPELLRQPLPAPSGRDTRVPYAIAIAVGLCIEAWRMWKDAA